MVWDSRECACAGPRVASKLDGMGVRSPTAHLLCCTAVMRGVRPRRSKASIHDLWLVGKRRSKEESSIRIGQVVSKGNMVLVVATALPCSTTSYPGSA